MNTEIIEYAYFGNHEVIEMYQGEDLVWPTTPPVPPGPDILLNWISNGSSRTQPNVYFDTCYNVTKSTQVEVKYSYHTRVNDTALFGVYKQNGAYTKEYSFMLRGSYYDSYPTVKYSTQYRFGRIGYNSSTYTSYNGLRISDNAASLDTPHILRIAATTAAYSVNYDGSATTGFTLSADDVSGLENLYLFAAKDGDSDTPTRFAPAETRIYYLKIYDTAAANPMMYRWLIPVLHYSPRRHKYVPCFYDKVSNTYFYNKGRDNLSYEVNGDYLLDFIERDTTGYLTYMTNLDVSTNINVNIGFTVCDTSTRMEDLTQNIVFGAKRSASVKYGLYFPYRDSSTVYAYEGAMTNEVTAIYDYNVHVEDNHHADNMEMYSSTSTNSFKWIEFEDGVLPDASTRLKHDYSVSSSTVKTDIIGYKIGLFGDNNMHAQKTTKIYFIDFSRFTSTTVQSTTVPIQTSIGSFVPVIHNNQVCFYDYVTNSYLSNTGTGIPNYASLE